jgi:hypothetical protein
MVSRLVQIAAGRAGPVLQVATERPPRIFISRCDVALFAAFFEELVTRKRHARLADGPKRHP